MMYNRHVTAKAADSPEFFTGCMKCKVANELLLSCEFYISLTLIKAAVKFNYSIHLFLRFS